MTAGENKRLRLVLAAGMSLGAVSCTSNPSRVPLTTGVVEFRGLTENRLDDFRVIPEEGTALFRPENRRFAGVDGFWQRGQSGWFKIPGGCSVLVTPTGTEPAESGPASAAMYRRLKGSALAPGWQADEGQTAHPTDYPF